MLEEGEGISGGECGEGGKAYVATKIGGTVRAMADNPEDCGWAWLFALELAAFLGWHSWRDEGRGEVVVVGWLVGGDLWEDGGGHQVLYLSETKAYASPASSNIVPSCHT